MNWMQNTPELGSEQIMMRNVHYYVTDLSSDGAYGIAGVDIDSHRNAVTMPYIASRAQAETLAAGLTELQVSISEFRDAYLYGDLQDLLVLPQS